jgi:hypothetical protein
VTALIEVLDAIDPDPELEDDVREDVGDDEPSPGSFERMTDPLEVLADTKPAGIPGPSTPNRMTAIGRTTTRTRTSSSRRR